MTQLTTTRCSGAEITPHVDALAALRIRVFRDFPYLYDGDVDYERDYLATYERSPRSLAFLVHDGDALIGATTALPLEDEEPAFRQPLVDAGFDGYAIGGVSVGEGWPDKAAVLEDVLPHAPANAPRYLMGVGTPADRCPPERVRHGP